MKIKFSEIQNTLKKDTKRNKLNESGETVSFEENAEEDLASFSPEKIHEILKAHLVRVLQYYKDGEFLKDNSGKTAKKILWDFMSTIS